MQSEKGTENLETTARVIQKGTERSEKVLSNWKSYGKDTEQTEKLRAIRNNYQSNPKKALSNHEQLLMQSWYDWSSKRG